MLSRAQCLISELEKAGIRVHRSVLNHYIRSSLSSSVAGPDVLTDACDTKDLATALAKKGSPDMKFRRTIKSKKSWRRKIKAKDIRGVMKRVANKLLSQKMCGRRREEQESNSAANNQKEDSKSGDTEVLSCQCSSLLASRVLNSSEWQQSSEHNQKFSQSISVGGE